MHARRMGCKNQDAVVRRDSWPPQQGADGRDSELVGCIVAAMEGFIRMEGVTSGMGWSLS
jgi:hypothetical protein